MANLNFKPVSELTPEEAEKEVAALTKYFESKPSISSDLMTRINRFKELYDYQERVLFDFEQQINPIMREINNSLNKVG